MKGNTMLDPKATGWVHVANKANRGIIGLAFILPTRVELSVDGKNSVLSADELASDWVVIGQ